MVLGKKSSSKALFHYLMTVAISCFALALATIIGVIVVIVMYGPDLFNGPYITPVVVIFFVAMAGGGTWFTLRFLAWKRAPEALVYLDDDRNLCIYSKKQIVTINRDDITMIYGTPESLGAKYLANDYGTLTVATKQKSYDVKFVERVTSLPDYIFDTLNIKRN